jgi:hypothetical protein
MLLTKIDNRKIKENYKVLNMFTNYIIVEVNTTISTLPKRHNPYCIVKLHILTRHTRTS